MTIAQLKDNKMVLFGSFVTALALSLAVISPVLASVQKNAEAQSNCANLKYPAGQEVTVLADSDAGTVQIGYTDETGAQKQTLLNFKSNDGYIGCSPQAKTLMVNVNDDQDKYNSDMCKEMTDVVEGRQPMPEMDGKQPTMEAAKTFQQAICAMAANK
jgi:hypothetical protein